MGKEAKRNFQPLPISQEFIEANNIYQHSSWMIKIDSTKEDSYSSNSSSSSMLSDLMEDTSSFSSSSTSSSSNGPLYKLSDLMVQLPIKRGISKYYEGKSQSFTSLASVESLEDLVKSEKPYRKRMKLCKSYGGRFCSPKATISKKASFSSTALGRIKHL